MVSFCEDLLYLFQMLFGISWGVLVKSCFPFIQICRVALNGYSNMNVFFNDFLFSIFVVSILKKLNGYSFSEKTRALTLIG